MLKMQEKKIQSSFISSEFSILYLRNLLNSALQFLWLYPSDEAEYYLIKTNKQNNFWKALNICLLSCSYYHVLCFFTCKFWKSQDCIKTLLIPSKSRSMHSELLHLKVVESFFFFFLESDDLINYWLRNFNLTQKFWNVNIYLQDYFKGNQF